MDSSTLAKLEKKNAPAKIPIVVPAPTSPPKPTSLSQRINNNNNNNNNNFNIKSINNNNNNNNTINKPVAVKRDLLTDLYRPLAVKDLVGNPSLIKRLQSWLTDWFIF